MISVLVGYLDDDAPICTRGFVPDFDETYIYRYVKFLYY